ncbi:MAG: 2-C-methyl-D-erythritol 4-phosphate cytidylyltransferase, partial [Planctomycetota bacterium]
LKHNAQDVTDDASLLALTGTSVKIVDGGAGNFKITTPADLKIAEALIDDDREYLRKLTATLPTDTDHKAKTRIIVRPNSAIFTELPSSETIIELKPSTEKTDQLPAALALFHVGHIEAALVGAAEIVEYEPDNARAHLLMGECYHQLGQLDRALLMAENAIGADGQNANAWRLKGELLLEEDHESKSGMAALAAARSLRHQQRGRDDQAKKQRETAIRLDSSLEKLM